MRSPLLATFALAVAASAEPLARLMQGRFGPWRSTRVRRTKAHTASMTKAPLFAAPALSNWLMLYRRHRMAWGQGAVTIGAVESIEGFNLAYSDLNALKRNAASMARVWFAETSVEERRTEVREAAKAVCEDMATEVRDLMAFIRDEPQANAEAERRAVHDSPGALFVALVWLPCWILHGKHPTHLLRKARQGDVNALTDLLRLDKAVIGDPKVADHLHRASIENPARFAKMMVALQSRPDPRRLETSKVKVALAALIVQFARFLDDRLAPVLPGYTPQRLTDRDVLDLFDLVARERQRGVVGRDLDLPTSLEAFSKGIKREKHWPQLVGPGHKSR